MCDLWSIDNYKFYFVVRDETGFIVEFTITTIIIIIIIIIIILLIIDIFPNGRPSTCQLFPFSVSRIMLFTQ